MTIVARKGKLSLTNVTTPDIAWQRVEDALTADVFGAYRYLPLNLGLIPFLLHAHDEHHQRLSRYLQDRGVSLEQLRYARFALWPTFEDGREPDVLILLGQSRDDLRVALLVEAKLYSSQHEIKDRHGVSRCQVAHYTIQHHRNHYASPANLLDLPPLRITLYITRSATCPDGELARIRAEVAAVSTSAAPDELGIFWVSWSSAGLEAVRQWHRHRDLVTDQPWVRILLDLREDLAARQLLPRPAFRSIPRIANLPHVRVYAERTYLRPWARHLPPLHYVERSYQPTTKLKQLPSRLYA